MLTTTELDEVAKARLRDAEVLFEANRYDGAVYLCGYAVEISLKARVCKTLGWLGYPFTRTEFQNLQSFKTHSLDVLLTLSGIESKIKTNFLAPRSRHGILKPAINRLAAQSRKMLN